MPEKNSEFPTLPPDDLSRDLAVFRMAKKENHRHVGLVGDTYTVTVTGEDTNERFTVIDMHVPHGGGPPAHRHDFEETFIVLEGEVEATFRGRKTMLRAGDTAHIPANAPHRFHNVSSEPARLICICSPAGQERFFLEVGIPVSTRTTAPPEMDEQQQAEFIRKVEELAPKYRTELLKEA